MAKSGDEKKFLMKLTRLSECEIMEEFFPRKLSENDKEFLSDFMLFVAFM